VSGCFDNFSIRNQRLALKIFLLNSLVHSSPVAVYESDTISHSTIQQRAPIAVLDTYVIVLRFGFRAYSSREETIHDAFSGSSSYNQDCGGMNHAN
jgi:hypothetical protein